MELSEEAKKLAQKHQEMHKVIHPWTGIISEFITEKVTKNWLSKTDFTTTSEDQTSNILVDKDRICAAVIWCECLGNQSTKNMRTSDAKLINDILNTLKFEDRVLVKTRMKFGKYGLQRGFAIKMKS